MSTITLVEDDEILRENFSDLLKSEGFTVLSYADYSTAFNGFQDSLPDLALLDISLGNDTEAGFSLCRELRKLSETLPIIFFTSHASDMDKISGMRLGADDYLTKDISFEYLIVRIKALLRRIEIFSAPGTATSANRHKLGKLEIDMDSMSINWDRKPIPLSLTQIYIVADMANNPGKARSPAQLMKAAGIVVEPNTIAAHIKNIRNTIRETDPGFNAIMTERAAGYRWGVTDSRD